ncbi:MAG: GNAT family N-acetyltransferase [Maribacter sp.]
MISNPFTSDTFSTIWSKHFSQSLSATHFSSLNNLRFEKHKFLPLYFNYGKTHTKGISYDFVNSNIAEIKGKVLLIYDVPTYFRINNEFKPKSLKLHKIKQYPGFLIELESFKDLNEYLANTFNKSSRYKLKKYKNKLEACFDVNYKMFYGEMLKSEYDFIFEAFNNLLTKRFNDKQESNNNLEKQEWDFYYEVAYPMILEKKAGLFVIYNGSQPIGVTLNYFSEDILFDAITVFDIDYAKFHLGSITIMKLIEWSIQQNIKIFDFSKGYFDYKKRWATKEYDFEYHIYHDPSSISSKAVAILLKNFFRAKQFLRDKKVNEKLHQLTFWLRNKSNKNKSSLQYEFSNVEQGFKKEELTEVDLKSKDNDFLKPIIFDFLYLNNESFKNLKIHRVIDDNSLFIIQRKPNNVNSALRILN